VSLSLKESGQRTTAGATHARVRSSLVVAEVALAVVLVVGAGLLLRSFWNLTTADAGFNRSRLTTFGIVLPAATYSAPESSVAFFRRLLQQLSEQSGVQSVAAMTGLPPVRQVNANDTDFEGYTAPPEGPFENVDYYQTVTAEYLKTMGIPLVEGRDFTASDAAGAPVVRVNETLARTFYKTQTPLGRRLKISGPARPWFTIVGVVRDVKQGGISARTGTELYFLDQQGPAAAGFAPRNMHVVVRSSLPVETLAPQIRRVVEAMDPTLPVVKLRSMEDVFAESVSRPRLLAQLLGIFAGLALMLAAIGTYGILSYSVTERRREIGIHIALGATRANVLRMVLGQGLRLTTAGLVLGVAASFGVARVLQSQLFNVRPSDPATLAAVGACIAVVAFAACYIPASRATRVDPMIVLRDD
ncbi:MAG: ABC transporter permease, partial [Acidobacteriota bacterium]|nr:ABC transporter permease [Acidobacteriota bacterium]